MLKNGTGRPSRRAGTGRPPLAAASAALRRSRHVQPGRDAQACVVGTSVRTRKRPNLSLQGRVRQMLVSAILSGHLPPGAPVPSSRHLADHLRIARNTVVFAYQQLVSEGYLVSRERSGHFVSDSVMQGICKTPRRAMARPPQQRRPMTRSAPRAGTSGCAFDPRCNAISSSRATGRNSPTPSSMASSTKTCFPPPNGASAVSRRCRCWTSAAGRRTSSPTTTPR